MAINRTPTRNRLQELRPIPPRPGVYLFKDRKGKILYVGKARQLDSRVKNHFGPTSEDPRHASMMTQVRDVDYIATQSEIEALILEANLIKQHRPKYNINLRDDKRYPFLKVTVAEDFPRIVLTRRLEDDGSRYFGPFTDVKSVRQGIRLLRGAFRLRSCPGDEPGRLKDRECLDHQIKICSAPCTMRIDKEGYRSLVNELLMCLSGQSEDVIHGVKEEMKKASDERDYEKCTRLRDRIGAIESALRRQHVFVLRAYDSDVFGLARHGDLAAVVILKVREGKVLGKEALVLEGVAARSDEEMLSFVMSQYYLNAAVIPKEILLPVSLEGEEAVVKQWLSERAAKEVELRAPKRGEGAALERMAKDNAVLALEESRIASGEKLEKVAPEVGELQEALDLPALPARVEAFDISQMGGRQAVASVVVFHNGQAKRSEYRRMRIKGVVGQDDFHMMEEVVRRRLERLLREKKPLPDFILVDGGKAQISAAVKAIKAVERVGGVELAIAQAGAGQPSARQLGVIGLVKGKEELNFSWREASLQLPLTSKALRLLQRMRDEAHRSAIMYHRKLRTKATIRSELDGIEGIGREKRRALLRHFGSVQSIRAASVEQIRSVDGIGPALAARIVEELRGGATQSNARGVRPGATQTTQELRGGATRKGSSQRSAGDSRSATAPTRR
ncbi:MAG: excinuclease ABC subunit UvrC [Candidatus Eisenbacteria bacterium]|nr:excinuclease ABC subunit UvrC [Candidatus Eisenbacteria bacterium]